MNRLPRSSSRVRTVVLGGVAALALGLAVAGCGPKQKFCVDASDYVCEPAFDAPVRSDVSDTAPQDKGSIYVGNDAGTNG
jgi:hypothetical protein